MTPRRLLALTCLASTLLAACGGGDDPAPPPPSDWREVPGMICGDGTPTGIAISPGAADAVMVFLMGGGACWSDTDCDVTTRGPFGQTQFELLRAFGAAGTVFDRSVPGNPFADWTLVFVPYCTGDVHVGQSARTHAGVSWNHHGRANLALAVAAITAALPAPAKVAVTGSSAGGFGSLLAYDLLRSEWPGPATAAYLVNDSGPTLVAGDLPATLLDAWWSSWGLDTTMAWCTGCKDDLSQAWDVLAASHPGDRLAFLSTTEDEVMRGFFGAGALMDATEFGTAVRALALKIDGLPAANAFVVGAPSATAHAMFLAPAQFATGGTSLLGWLGQMVGDDPAWTSVGPPFAQAP